MGYSATGIGLNGNLFHYVFLTSPFSVFEVLVTIYLAYMWNGKEKIFFSFEYYQRVRPISLSKYYKHQYKTLGQSETEALRKH